MGKETSELTCVLIQHAC